MTETEVRIIDEAPLRYLLSLPPGGEGGEPRPVLVFLHGFPEAAFVWDPLLQHFARPENGGWRCVAPNLRG
ncbi:MAG TPA: alpha/beta fold hydrolase, partial [Longimicrobium sp.]|nr:alpha/beta fold hydrolase [Longimicrobium sp.]